MTMTWIDTLKSYAERHPIVVLRFSADEWESLVNSRRGLNEFTFARLHSQVADVKVPAPCLLIGKHAGTEKICFGLVTSKSAITTLDSRIKVSRSVDITPSSVAKMAAIVTESPFAKNIATRLKSTQLVTLLSPKLSSHLISLLAEIQSNKGGMRAVAESLSIPKRFKGNAALQEDAVQTALAVFGLDSSDQPSKVELVEGRATALGRVAIMEDSVVEHDARSVPDYSLIKSDVTGRALFQKGDEQLEVFTANRRELEHCFGVDLIYVNLTKQNVVMLQYKMLEAAGKDGDHTDWIYRPDGQLDAEINRMKAFAASHLPGPKEYRLNPQVFYMKFVKRDAMIKNGGIITPLDHFEKVRVDPSFKGPKKGLRLSYRSLNGRYLRQTPFLDLIKCGYIGAHAKTSDDLRVIIEAILDGNKAVVAAVQQKVGT
ncbi:MAG TPA: hypothetical protein PLJ94_05390 [Methylotenera sp.]|nr:hypothetical protein [Methylotenera sp.]HPM49886.1 hypothetical protein [Methylotenera sp.]